MLGCGYQHHITRLEVTIEEAVAIFSRKVFGQHAEIGFELQFVEIQIRRFQEAVLEIVEVEEHAILIEGGLRIAVFPLESAGSAHLDIGQLADGELEQLFLPLVIASASLTSAADSIKERHLPKVFLQIAQFIVARGKYTRNGKLQTSEMTGQIDEGMVFVATGAYDANNRLLIGTHHPVILAVAPGTRQFLHSLGVFPTPFLI